MLNQAEKFKILKFIKKCYSFGLFPAVIDLGSWKLLPHSTTAGGKKGWLRWACFGLFVLHSLYEAGTFLAPLFSCTSTPLHELVIHAIVALFGPLLMLWYYLFFINNPGAFAIFFHMTLTGNIGGMRTNTQGWRRKENIVSRLKEYNLQDLIASNMFYMMVPTVVAMIGMYIYYPSLGLLLYAGLPEQLQVWWSFGVLLLEEMRYILMICAMAVPMLILQIISFELISNQLRSLIHTIQRTNSRQTLTLSYMRLRHIQLYVNTTNVVNQFVIFSWKGFCIGTSIGTGYAAIAHFSDYPIFGVMYYIMLINCTFIYVVNFDRAFQIPGLFKKAEQLCLLRFHQNGHGDMGILKRQMRSIPRVGIKVGELHLLERESTPVFVHFVLNNIVSMLVAY